MTELNLKAAVCAARNTREFQAGAAFGVPEDAYDQYLTGILRAAIPHIGAEIATEIAEDRSGTSDMGYIVANEKATDIAREAT